MSNAHSNEVYAIPELVSLTFTPNEIELTAPSTNLKFELVVSHPIGIENSKVSISLNSAAKSNLTLDLFRTDVPINRSLNTVTFNGSIDIPRNIKSGVYKVESGQIIGIAPKNSPSNPVSSSFKINKIMNKIVGAETDLIIRSGGDLNFDYQTFIGPSHATLLKIARELPKLSKIVTPIWKVGETYIPSEYYELKVPELELTVSSKNPEICVSDGKKLTFIAVGSCSFLVFTKKNSNYIYKQDEQLATITGARTPQELIIENIPSQNASNLPKLIQIPRVNSGNFGFLIPKSLTPTVCLVSDGFINIFTGGICRYSYQSEATPNSLASKVYELEFEIIRDPQTILFALPSTANVSNRSITLAATSSSGGAITYTTTSTGICSITESNLNLLRSGNCTVSATQAGTSILAPASATATVMLIGAVVTEKKSITCVKGKSTKKVSGANLKCPKGYKLKK
jgi:hypothetical protein